MAKENRDTFCSLTCTSKAFIDYYYGYLVNTDISLAMAINKSSKVPQQLLRGKLNIHEFEDGEIIDQPFGMVFLGKKKKGKLTMLLFQVNEYKLSCFKYFDLYNFLQEE